jgi:hypothetical protein
MTRTVVAPWEFVEPTLEEARALKAVAVGEATSEQQKRALSWIIHRACGYSLDPFAPGQPDVMANRVGRRGVAVLITQVLLTKSDDLRKHGETDV